MTDHDTDPKFPYSIHVLGGGTVFHVRPHLALAAPAYGRTAHDIHNALIHRGHMSRMHLTRMCGARNGPETNADVAKLLDQLVADPNTKMIFMSMALCDFEGAVGYEPTPVSEPWSSSGALYPENDPGKHQPRLKSNREHYLVLSPADKLIGRIRRERKDIFLVGFKTTAGATPEDQYFAGLGLVKNASCNLVLANDVHTRLNMVITPEQAHYHETTDRREAIEGLVEMATLRSKLTFTRARVVPGDPVPWTDDRIPASLRTVVDYCIAQGAYKPFNGSTVGHFAVKLSERAFLTSRRKTDFNKLADTGLVFVEAAGPDTVTAYGSKPSVGGQSQRIIFREHPGYDCIVHFHCPMKKGSDIPVRSQRAYECGSHECGKNTSDGLAGFHGESRKVIKAVMLDHHGPNIVFNRDTDPQEVIRFIDENFDLKGRTDAWTT